MIETAVGNGFSGRLKRTFHSVIKRIARWEAQRLSTPDTTVFKRLDGHARAACPCLCPAFNRAEARAGTCGVGCQDADG